MMTTTTMDTMTTGDSDGGCFPRLFQTQVAAAVAAVAAVDGEEGVQWRRWGGHSMAESAAR